MRCVNVRRAFRQKLCGSIVSGLSVIAGLRCSSVNRWRCFPASCLRWTTRRITVTSWTRSSSTQNWPSNTSLTATVCRSLTSRTTFKPRSTFSWNVCVILPFRCLNCRQANLTNTSVLYYCDVSYLTNTSVLYYCDVSVWLVMHELTLKKNKLHKY